VRPRIPPRAVITFAAKTGFITKEIFNEFFATGCDRSRRRQWQNLSRHGWMVAHESPLRPDVLVLSRKSRAKSHAGAWAEVWAPYIGMIHHDEILYRMVMGLQRSGLIREWTTEAEMKKVAMRDLRLGGARINTKYPDALLTLDVPGNAVKVALELELSRKSKRRYEDMAYAYRGMKDVRGVFFVCRNPGLVATIKNAFARAYFPTHDKPLGFALVDEWRINPARAVLEMPSRKTTFFDLVGEIREKRHAMETENAA
jgi:hypothetical protein